MPGLRLVPGADAAAQATILSRIEADLQQAGVVDELADRVMIVAGELLANAAEHGATSTRLCWTVLQDRVEIAVEGAGPRAGAVRAAPLPESAATRGRGLFLIASLADSLHDAPRGLVATLTTRKS